MWTLENLLRLSHSSACRELSDLARSSALTYGERHAHGGELAELAEHLVAAAEEVRLLAVAVERQRGASWETIGEVLAGGVSKQAAQARFGDRVDELVLDVLLPLRDGPPWPDGTASRWTAGPDAVVDPDTSLARLDEWAARHHERTDLGDEHVDELVSHGLRERLRSSDGRPREAISRISTVTLLANLMMEATGAFARRELPSGVTQAYARRRLLEEKVALYDAMRREAHTPQALADALKAGDEAWVELVDLQTEEAHDVLTVVWRSSTDALITYRSDPVAVLQWTDDGVDGETRGWWLWGVDADGGPDDRSGAWPELVSQLEEWLTDTGGRDALQQLAIDIIAKHIGSDLAKGIGPREPGGIAGPPSAADPRTR